MDEKVSIWRTWSLNFFQKRKLLRQAEYRPQHITGAGREQWGCALLTKP